MITATAHPNLALVKYWGKADVQKNLPASSSLGISLNAFSSTTEVEKGHHQSSAASTGHISYNISINGSEQNPVRYESFFSACDRLYSGSPLHLSINSSNNFPTAAGLASSSSGFAALAAAVSKALNLNQDSRGLSALARIGSGSASRSVFGGFVAFPEMSEYAYSVHDENHWPELACVIVQISGAQKHTSSRQAMEMSRSTSPYFGAWVEDSRLQFNQALEAVQKRDIEMLGPIIRRSYMRMFSTMFSSEDPVVYWQEGSIRAMRLTGELRSKAIPVYETMDAGPQVKLITLKKHVQSVLQYFAENGAEGWKLTDSGIGGPCTVQES